MKNLRSSFLIKIFGNIIIFSSMNGNEFDIIPCLLLLKRVKNISYSSNFIISSLYNHTYCTISPSLT